MFELENQFTQVDTATVYTMEGIKIVVVGDGAVGMSYRPRPKFGTNKKGKTALIITFINDSFPADYLPTIADKFQKNLSVDSVKIVNS